MKIDFSPPGIHGLACKNMSYCKYAIESIIRFSIPTIAQIKDEMVWSDIFHMSEIWRKDGKGMILVVEYVNFITSNSPIKQIQNRCIILNMSSHLLHTSHNINIYLLL